MATAAVAPLIAITTITAVLNVFVLGLTHSLEFRGELVRFCAALEETNIVIELIDLVGKIVIWDTKENTDVR